MKFSIMSKTTYESWQELEVWDDETRTKIGFIDIQTMKYIKHLATRNQVERDKLNHQAKKE